MSTAQFKNLKTGEILSETTYYRLDKVVSGGIDATTSTGAPIHIGAKVVEDNLFSATQYQEEKKLTQTELAELLSNTQGKVFEVSFQKQATSSSVNEAISTINNGKIASNSQISNTIGVAFRGEERVLRGYLLSVEPLMGRAKVVDLEVQFNAKQSDYKQSSIRLVDLRHINYIIFQQVKYSLKK